MDLQAFVLVSLLQMSLLVGAQETGDLDSSRRFPRYRFNIRKDDIFHDTRVIPVEHQVSAFLYKGETKLWVYIHCIIGIGICAWSYGPVSEPLFSLLIPNP